MKSKRKFCCKFVQVNSQTPETTKAPDVPDLTQTVKSDHSENVFNGAKNGYYKFPNYF